MFTIRLSSTLLCLAAALVSVACRRAVTPIPGQVAVEGPPGQFVTIATGVSVEFPAARLTPLKGRTPSLTHIDTIKMDYRIVGDKVIVTVYALTLPPGDPHRYDDSGKQLLAVHSARLDQTFELKEFEKIGYRPLSYKVVSAKPPAPTHPTLISEVPSMEIALKSEDRSSYTLLFRNLSDRDVVAYAYGNNHGTVHWMPLIAARASHEQPMVSIESPIILQAALFSNGSHEGDAEVAATLYAYQAGNRTERSRADPMIRRIVADRALDDTAKIARIRTELLTLPKTPDAPMTRAMRTAFPGLPAATIKADLERGLDQGVRNIWSSLYSFEHQSGVYPPPPSHPPLARWWPDER